MGNGLSSNQKPTCSTIKDGKTNGTKESNSTGEYPAWITPELIAETLETWQPYYAESLTTADAVEILCTVGGLLDGLGEDE